MTPTPPSEPWVPLRDTTVALYCGDERCSHGVVAALQVNGVEGWVDADFRPLDAPSVPIGEPASMILFEDGTPVPATGRVVFRSEDAVRSRYRLQLEERSAESLARVLDRRRAPRVRAAAGAPVQVALVQAAPGGREGDGCSVPAELRDVSESGLSLRVGREAERELCGSWRVRLELLLPGGSDPLRLEGKVRSRRLDGELVRYGVELDFAASEAGRAGREQLAAYVLERQRGREERSPSRRRRGPSR